MNAVKNKGGRPRRTEEKLQRVTLNLRPAVAFGLEMVARHRRTSLNQAAEYLLLKLLRDYKIEDKPIIANLEETISGLASIGRWTEEEADGTEVDIPKDERDLELQARLFGSAGGKALLIPDSLQTPNESYFNEAFEEVFRGDWSEHKAPAFVILLLPEAIEKLYDQSKVFEEKGIPAKEAGLILQHMAMHAVDIQAEQTPWFFIKRGAHQSHPPAPLMPKER